MATMSEDELVPPAPNAPQASDCCGTGCSPCVHDIYSQDLKDWKKECKRIQEGSLKEEKSEQAISSTSYKDFKLTEICKISESTFMYTFHLENNGTLGLSVGQHIILKQLEENCIAVTRQYTPISELSEIGCFKILIKIYENGRMSKLIQNWKVGDMIPWRGPHGSFRHTKQHKHMLLLGAGTGIAPLYQIIRYIVNNEEDETIIKLYYSSKCFDDLLLRSELLEFSSNWNFTMVHFLSEEKIMSKKRYKENVELSRVKKQDIASYIIDCDMETVLILICGPKSYTKDMINFSKDLKVPENNIFKF